jgi:serine/tyrosine/threonine adenylyltransferase
MSSEDNNPINIKFDNTFIKLPDTFYKRVLPSKVSNPNLVFYNSKLADRLQIPKADLETLTQTFSGQLDILGSDPIAQAYAGHQFGHFVPQLGDGRAILLGEVLDTNHKRWDLQLKGAGLTPFSRGGDGLAPLGPMLREYIVSEAMNALGVPTTRALALISTGDKVNRETVLPGAILTRVASSHIRVGTFEFFASRNDFKNLKILADYVIQRHYPDAAMAENPYLELLKNVLNAQAQLIARWMGLGFIHGVMNTDNMTISGETIDYGPCAFMDFYDPNKVLSSIDRRGRYAYKNQPEIAEWNLSVFASCLLPLISDPKNQNFGSYDDYSEKNELYSEKNVLVVQDQIDSFEAIYNYYWLREMKQKLGLKDFNKIAAVPEAFDLNHENQTDFVFAQSYLNLIAEQKIDFTMSFRTLSESVNQSFEDSKFASLFLPKESAKAWFKHWNEKLKLTKRSEVEISASMNLKNPAFIPRNHLIDKAIKEAELKNDFNFAEILLSHVMAPFKAPESKDMEFTYPPKPEEQITKTFCGT